MSYRNGKLPSTGSIIADVLIGMIAAYAVAAVILTLFGRFRPRKHWRDGSIARDIGKH